MNLIISIKTIQAMKTIIIIGAIVFIMALMLLLALCLVRGGKGKNTDNGAVEECPDSKGKEKTPLGQFDKDALRKTYICDGVCADSGERERFLVMSADSILDIVQCIMEREVEPCWNFVKQLYECSVNQYACTWDLYKMIKRLQASGISSPEEDDDELVEIRSLMDSLVEGLQQRVTLMDRKHSGDLCSEDEEEFERLEKESDEILAVLDKLLSKDERLDCDEKKRKTHQS